MTDGQFSVQDPRIGVEGLKRAHRPRGTRARLSKLEGQINGGTLGGRGSVAYTMESCKIPTSRFRRTSCTWISPAGLKTVSDIKAAVEERSANVSLSVASVLVKEGGFTR